MTQKLLLVGLLSGTLCSGQSVLTTPTESTRSVPGSAAVPASGESTPVPTTRQMGERTDSAGSPVQVPEQAPAPPQYRIVGPLTTKSDFERFAEDGTGHRLAVYGRRLFDEVPTTFAPVERVPVPADYVLGPGDELLIRAWGKIDLDSRVTVDRDGQVYLPRIGTLNVAGLRYEQLEGYLHAAISALFKDFELNVALGQLRSIQIFVLGSARQPGAYTIGSLSTLVNALFASGGPSASGSMRHIQLRRGNQLLAEFDMYDLVQKGDKSHDVPLLPGDVIYIPPIGAQIAISGHVNQPGIYELKGETTLAAAIEGAGGLTSLAGAERVLLERIENHSTRRLEEFPLDASGLARLLKDGDLLRVFPLSPKFANAVTLRGNVAQPGRYMWKEGMRVSDLIPSRDFLITRDFWNRQNKPGPGNANHPFGTQRAAAYSRIDQAGERRTGQLGNPRTDQPGSQPINQTGSQPTEQLGNSRADRLDDQSDEQYDDQSDDRYDDQSEDQRGDQATDQGSQIAGPTGQAGNQRNDMSGASDRSGNSSSTMIATVGQNNAEINWEYAVIERLDEHDLSTRLIPFRLVNAIDNRGSGDNQLLRAGDVVTIFSRADLNLPVERHASFVRVGGEVNAPGVYRVNPGETLREVVEEAGGLTPHSYLYASLLTRVSTRHAQEEQLQQATEQMQRELVARYANATPTSGQSASDQQVQLSLQQAALARLAAIKPTGRVVLAMQPDAATVADIPAFSLEDGDAFYIPPRLSTVQVEGSVYNANAFRQQPEKRLVAYLNDAGGATREADPKRMFVIHADGTVVSRQARNSHGSFDKLRLLPGDAIIVPEKLRVTSKVNDFLQVTQFMSQTALTAAALSVIK
jgi:protein involved in polysaccharide export with SLBB domain